VIYDIGDQVKLSTVVKDTSGTLVNTPTLTLLVTKPDASTTSPSVTNTAAGGVYTAVTTVDQAGTWTYAWTASGTVIAVEPGQFTVRAQTVYVVSLEEFKAQLNRTDSADDVEMRSYLASATRYVEYRIGGPVSVQTFTERQFVVSPTITPRRRPLVSITSITPDFGTALPVSAYTPDLDMNQILFYYTLLPAWHTIVYRAGLALPPENVKLAGMIVAQHLWDTQNGFAGRRNADDLIQTQFGFAVPRRAAEMLSIDAIAGVS
jgi:hypothetical protein